MKLLMVASENDALPGGKVGGIGDVLRDIPKALADAGQEVNVVVPGYGHFSTLPGSCKLDVIPVEFAGNTHSLQLYRIDLPDGHQGVTQYAIEHPLFGEGGVGRIYCDDPPDRPFASDASKFALFCAGVAQAIVSGKFGKIDVLHLHDWHSALLAVLRAYDDRFRALQSITTVYTIHNLALQGIRPLQGDVSSLLSWYPGLKAELNQVIDPRYPNCVNPMRCGINLSDKLHVVSDAYAHEILKPSDPAKGFFGGEGLELDLQRAKDEHRLFGILNGCEYSVDGVEPLAFESLLHTVEDQLLLWLGKTEVVKSAHIVALKRLERLMRQDGKTPKLLVTSVGRLTEQKASLLQQPLADGQSALEALLCELGDDGLYICLGSGDKSLEAFMTQVASKHHNFVFLNGYSQHLADLLYACGELFLMPSSFEPCGISQMLSMRAGQLCLVHQVGGLKDTVSHLTNGFSFDGQGPLQQAKNMIAQFVGAKDIALHKEQQWTELKSNALQARFLWSDSAEQYIQQLYH